MSLGAALIRADGYPLAGRAGALSGAGRDGGRPVCRASGKAVYDEETKCDTRLRLVTTLQKLPMLLLLMLTTILRSDNVIMYLHIHPASRYT